MKIRNAVVLIFVKDIVAKGKSLIYKLNSKAIAKNFSFKIIGKRSFVQVSHFRRPLINIVLIEKFICSTILVDGIWKVLLDEQTSSL